MKAARTGYFSAAFYHPLHQAETLDVPVDETPDARLRSSFGRSFTLPAQQYETELSSRL